MTELTPWIPVIVIFIGSAGGWIVMLYQIQKVKADIRLAADQDKRDTLRDDAEVAAIYQQSARSAALDALTKDTRIESLAKRVDTLEHSNNALRVEVINRQAKVDELEKRIDLLEKIILVKDGKIAELETAGRLKDAQIADLQREVETLRGKVQQLENEKNRVHDGRVEDK